MNGVINYSKLVNPAPSWSFHLDNNGDQSDVIILLRSEDDIRARYEGDSSNNENMKIIIPLYDVVNDQVIFWTRSKFVCHQLANIFKCYKDPTQFVFRITRYGERLLTTYNIEAIANNTVKSYEDIYDAWVDKVPSIYQGILVSPYGEDLEDISEIEIDEHKLTPLTCKCCGGSIDKQHMTCKFCGTHYILPK